MSVLKNPAVVLGAGAAMLCMSAVQPGLASSHREAPFITELPKVDGTDFYMFRSYEAGREGFVTLIANYLPLQDPYGGPNYFTLDPQALYEIHVDNDGDAIEDLTFQFRFSVEEQALTVDTGVTDNDGEPVELPIPFINSVPAGIGPGVDDLEGVNRIETYEVTVQRDGRRSSAAPVNANNLSGDVDGDTTLFRKPVDNIGANSFSGDYASYANAHVFDIEVPGCDADAGDGTGTGRVFVGQRREGFVANLGEVFDLINTNPFGPRDAEGNDLDDSNVTSIALELPIGCLTADGEGPDTSADPVIGAWTTASLRQARVINPLVPLFQEIEDAPSIEGGPWTQVSRVGSPLVNEVVIGLGAKNSFNGNRPASDVNFLPFVTNPTLPVIIDSLFPGATTVPATPRVDLVATFLTGLRLTNENDEVVFNNQPAAIVNDDATARAGEMLRLNTALSPATSTNSDLGLLACDVTGFPNGRRVFDDVVDIALTVVEGAILSSVEDDPDTADTDESRVGNPNGLQTCDVSDAMAGPQVVNTGAVVTDGAQPNPADYLDVFPYLNTPIPGSPN